MHWKALEILHKKYKFRSEVVKNVIFWKKRAPTPGRWRHCMGAYKSAFDRNHKILSQNNSILCVANIGVHQNDSIVFFFVWVDENMKNCVIMTLRGPSTGEFGPQAHNSWTTRQFILRSTREYLTMSLETLFPEEKMGKGAKLYFWREKIQRPDLQYKL